MCIHLCLPSQPSSLILLVVVEAECNSFALHVLPYHIDNKSRLNNSLHFKTNVWDLYYYSIYNFQLNSLKKVPLELAHAALAVRHTTEAAFGCCTAHDTASITSKEVNHAWTEQSNISMLS